MPVVLYITIALLVLNGVMAVIGIPPISYWFRCHLCDKCEGTGFIKEKKRG